jgi:glutaredoxin
MKFISLFFIFLLSFPVLAGSLLIPDKETYHDFLIDPWKEDAPTIIAFKDPNCGYCIKALKNLAQYKNYNVFMFWSPILGTSSTTKVNDIFACDNPIGKDVINSVINRKAISCESTSLLKNKRAKLAALNYGVVSLYKPQSVPAFYFGGQKVRLNSLAKFKNDITNTTALVKLQWKRYEPIKVSKNGHSGLANAIVFIPNNFQKKDDLSNLLKDDLRYTWHLAESSCQSKNCVLTDKETLTEELKLLLNITEIAKPILVVNGMVIEPSRYGVYQLDKLANDILAMAFKTKDLN